MLEELSRRLIEGGYTADTPAAIVYKATWPEQKTFVCTVGTLAKTAAENNITKTALMIIGDTVAAAHYDRSKPVSYTHLCQDGSAGIQCDPGRSIVGVCKGNPECIYYR